MTNYLERCPVCNNLLLENDRCPICDDGQSIEDFNIPETLANRSLPVYKTEILFSLTTTAESSLRELGLIASSSRSSNNADFQKWLDKKPYVYVYNGGKSNEDEVKVIFRFATDVDHPVNLELKNRLGGTLELVGVFKAYKYGNDDHDGGDFYTYDSDNSDKQEYYTDDDEQDELLLISVGKRSLQDGCWGGNRCFFAQLSNSDIGNSESLVAAIVELPTTKQDQDEINRRMEQWRVYLDLLERDIETKQFKVRYRTFRGPENNRVIFYLDSSGAQKVPWNLIRNAVGWPIKLEHDPLVQNREIAQDDIFVDGEDDWEIGEIWDYSPQKATLTIELKNTANSGRLPDSGILSYDALGDKKVIERMQYGMRRLSERRTANAALPDFIFDVRNAAPIEQSLQLNHDQLLLKEIFDNEKQREAVEGALSAKDLFLIQGPPGTGKTTIIAEICYQIARTGGRVLIASQSNLAVDNAISRLVICPEMRAIRLGHPERVEEEGKPFIESNVVKKWLDDTRILVAKRRETERERIGKILGDLADVKEKIEILGSAIKLQNQKEEYKRVLQESEIQHKQLIMQKQALQRILENASNTLFSVVTQLQTIWDALPQNSQDFIIEGLNPPDDVSLSFAIKRGSSTDFHQVCDYLLDWLKIFSGDDQLEIAAIIAWRVLMSKKNRLGILAESMEKRILMWQGLNTESRKPLQALLQDELTKEIENVDRKIQRIELSKQYLKNIGFFQPNTDDNDMDALYGYLENWGKTKKWVEQVEQWIPQLLTQIGLWYKQSDKASIDIEKTIKDFRNQINAVADHLTPLLALAKSWGISISQKALNSLKKQLHELELEQTRLEQRQSQQTFVNAWLERLEHLTEKDVSDLHQIYIDNVNVVGATCSVSGRKKFMDDYGDFDCVIVDEVSKAIPPEIILPAIKGKKLVLVGDHKQLPPLLDDKDINEVAETLALSLEQKKQLKRSIFEELFVNADPSLAVRLTAQYRMHPQIMDAINTFYGGALECKLPNPDRSRAHGLDDLGILSNENHLVWIDLPNLPKFFEQEIGTSFKNEAEATITFNLAEKINELWHERLEQRVSLSKLQLGLISFYSPQAHGLKEKIGALNMEEAVFCRFGTVDRFQGMEKEVVIASLVRNNANNDIGFAKKPERINVAFSRAQKLLIIVGCSALFTSPKSGTSAKYYKSIFDMALRVTLDKAPSWLVKGII